MAIRTYKDQAKQAPEEVFRHCIIVLRECARSMLLHNVKDEYTLDTINIIREPLVNDYWIVVEHYNLTPKEAVLLIFQRNISSC